MSIKRLQKKRRIFGFGNMREEVPTFLCSHAGNEACRLGFPVEHRLTFLYYCMAYPCAASCRLRMVSVFDFNFFNLKFFHLTFQIEKCPRKAVRKRREQHIGRRQAFFKPAAGSDNAARYRNRTGDPFRLILRFISADNGIIRQQGFQRTL